MKFIDVVKIKKSGCTKCSYILYHLPCMINKDIVHYLVSFGTPVYRLDATNLLRIDTKDGFHIEGKVGGKKIKFAVPKSFAKQKLDGIDRKDEFEKRLADWLTDTLKIEVER